MVKKSVKKKTSKKSSARKTHKSPKELNIEKVLIENFISLQKVLSTMAIKFDKLSNEMSKLLELFATSAKTLAEKDVNLETSGQNEKQIIDKLDGLMDQNKTIAKGLLMMHGSPPSQKQPQQNQTPPQMKQAPKPEGTANLAGYKKSISSASKEE
jgi:hypothetical protein